MKVLVGSQAAKMWWPDFRAANDIDYFSTQSIEGAENFWHPDFMQWWSEDGIANPSELYTIKVSHAFWSLRNGSWRKHMADIKFMQENAPKELDIEANLTFHRKLYDILYPIWEDRHGKKRGSLNVEPEEFFNSNVPRIYVHDSIHESVAYGERPLFESVLKDGHQVMVDKTKFDALDFDTKCRLVREEVYATALERYVIPSNYTYSPRAAYAKALEKTITSFWRGDWALWIVLNYKDLYRPDRDFVAWHKQNSNRLIPLQEKVMI